MMECDLRLGRWQDVLGDVECDALITDPPYSARVHDGHYAPPVAGAGATQWPDGSERRAIGYSSIDDDDVREIVTSWAPRTRGWMCVMSDHVLAQSWAEHMSDAGRYVYAPLSIVIPGMTVRLLGDGPSSWTIWLTVSRPRWMTGWGTLPGSYRATRAGKDQHIGGKPESLMRSIVRDYSRAGDVVCDPFAGWGTTLLAARTEGRRAVGSEMDTDTYAMAQRRLARGYTPVML